VPFTSVSTHRVLYDFDRAPSGFLVNVFIQRIRPLPSLPGKFLPYNFVADVPKKSSIGLNCGILGGFIFLSARRITLLSKT
jgi:hypothetical protein